MSGVSNQWNISLDFEGLSFPSTVKTVPVCNVIESVHQNLPSLQLKIHDSDGKYTRVLAGGDGTKIGLTLGDGGGGEQSSTWSVQGDPTIQHGVGYNMVTVKAVLDKVAYMRKIACGLYEGNSSSVLRKIAGEVGLSFDGGAASDKQVWLPNNKTLAGFAKHVVAHAYGGSSSVFMHSVTESGSLKFKDLTTLLGGGKTAGVGQQLEMLTYEIQSLGAVGNHNRAAGSTTAGFKADGVLDELNKIPSLKFSNFGSFSSGFQDAIGDLGGKLDHAIRDAGNTHEMFYQARHQNSRLRNTFSLDLVAMFDKFTGYELLDPAELYPQSFIHKEDINEAFSGNYIVSAKTRSLRPTQYIEKVTFTSQGAN